MELVYIAHPYTGDEEANTKRAQAIRAGMQQEYPDKVFLTPLGIFGDKDNQSVDYCQELGQCLELLSRCDTVIFCDGWEESAGCRAEMAFALQQRKKIIYEGAGYEA